MLLIAKYVIPVTSPYIEDGAVLVRDDKILDLGPASQLKDKYPEEEIRDFGLSVLMPGFVDVHTHLGYTALRGMFGDLPYAEWKRQVLHTEPFFTEEDWLDSARSRPWQAASRPSRTSPHRASRASPPPRWACAPACTMRS